MTVTEGPIIKAGFIGRLKEGKGHSRNLLQNAPNAGLNRFSVGCVEANPLSKAIFANHFLHVSKFLENYSFVRLVISMY